MQNDRAGEVGRILNVKDFDLERIFGQEGVQIVHMSGLIAALSPNTGQLLPGDRPGRQEAWHAGSFDLNYRATFWKGREDELSGIFPKSPGRRTSWWATKKTFSSASASKARRRGARIWRQDRSFKGMIDG